MIGFVYPVHQLQNARGEALTSGIVFDIQRFSTHDGPGIRTTVFLKGCPLSCLWCHNPESKQAEPAVVYDTAKCLRCGLCAKACLQGAISFDKGIPTLDSNRCVVCGRCSKRCPAEALELVGREMTVVEVLAEIEKDRVFYDESGGGVTVSGGEPLIQPEFLCALLQGCRQRGIHTTVDTCGHAQWQAMAKVSELTDVFLYDIKHMDSSKHHEFTGVSNELILENLKCLSRIHHGIILRLPIIPGLNDDLENLLMTGRLAVDLGISQVHLLPYHGIGADKYTRVGEVYRLPELVAPSPLRMEQIAAELRTLGLKVKIGG
ncbi:MAG: pyruvate formate lyase activating enzyme [Bacillota bacterium]|nr:MAG: pyruvate formate lyase activating enzyme [Bacillota bacterium]